MTSEILAVHGRLRAAVGPGRRPAARPGLRAVAETVMTWQERARMRHALSYLDERMLRDIGLTREEAEREARKPFWRA